MADCPDLTLEQLEEIYAQLGEVEEEVGGGFLQVCQEMMPSPNIVLSSGKQELRSLSVCDELPLQSSSESESGGNSGVMFFQDGAILLTDVKQQSRTGGLHQNRLYLDTCTASELMSNEAFLTKIFQSDKALTLHTNAGLTSTHWKGFRGSIEFWLNRHAMASVVSLWTLERKFSKVSYCSNERDAAFIVTTPNGEVVFKRCEVTGFPFIDLTEEGDDMAVQLVQANATKPTTIRKRYEGFTRREVEQAIKARRAQTAAGFPSCHEV